MSPLAERYYQSWQAGRSADSLEQFLAQCPEIGTAELVELLLVDQALRWEGGCGPSVEAYLQRFPAVLQRQSVLELVYGEMRAAQALGLALDPDAYAVRFPDLAEPVRRQMEVAAWLADEGEDAKPEDRATS